MTVLKNKTRSSLLIASRYVRDGGTAAITRQEYLQFKKTLDTLLVSKKIEVISGDFYSDLDDKKKEAVDSVKTDIDKQEEPEQKPEPEPEPEPEPKPEPEQKPESEPKPESATPTKKAPVKKPVRRTRRKSSEPKE